MTPASSVTAAPLGPEEAELKGYIISLKLLSCKAVINRSSAASVESLEKPLKYFTRRLWARLWGSLFARALLRSENFSLSIRISIEERLMLADLRLLFKIIRNCLSFIQLMCGSRHVYPTALFYLV